MIRPLLTASLLAALLGCLVERAAADAVAPQVAAGPAGGVAAATPRWDGAHPAVARIIVPQRDGMAFGSGTLVGAAEHYGLVVTNWHVVRDASGLVMVVFPDGFRSAAKLLKTDRVWDLAALAIWRPPGVAPVPICTYRPPLGEPLTIAGYGPGWYRAASGRCDQYVAPAERYPEEMIEVSTGARQGDSGGPIFNARGEVAGVLFGTSEGHTAGSYGGRVRAFLDTTLGDFEKLGPAPPQIVQQLALAPVSAPAATAVQAVNPAPARADSYTAAGGLAADSVVAALTAGSPPSPVASLAPASAPAPSVPAAAAPPPVAAVPPPIAVVSAPVAIAPPVVESTLPPPLVPGPAAGEPSQASATAAAVGARKPTGDSPMLTWADLTGSTRGEQIKTVLALVGLLSIFSQGLHLLAPAKPAPAKRRASGRAKKAA